MWYPNRNQWIAIWVTYGLAAFFWLVSTTYRSAIDGGTRFILVILGTGALLVWKLSRKKSERS